MKIEVPFHIGDKIEIDGCVEEIKGIHIYVTQNSDIAKWRIHIGRGKFVTVDSIKKGVDMFYGESKNDGNGYMVAKKIRT